MSWSLKLKNGDIEPNYDGVAVVTGFDKLLQDLKCYILEKIGTDQFHPAFGSRIDGGMVLGENVGSMLGSDHKFAALAIEDELRRIISALQKVQLIRARRDQMERGGVITLDQAEVLVSVSGVDISTTQDRMDVSIQLQTGDGSQIDFTTPIDMD